MDIILMYVKAFAIGGCFCVLGQLLLNYTKLTGGKVLVLFLLSGIVLGAIGVYPYLVQFAGAGATVPIVGFGNALAQGAIQGAKKGLVEALTGGLIATSAGITAAVVFGYINALLFRSRTKKMQ